MEMTRENVMGLVREHNSDEGHIRHALAVEATMRYFAHKSDADVELWGLTGLVHDVDWEETQETPEEHTKLAAKWLEEKGYPQEVIRAVRSHAWGNGSDVEPISEMEKTLYTIDELTGLIITTALVRPSRSLSDLTVKSVKKKWKDRHFAAGVDRELIKGGAEMLGIELPDLMGFVIEALRPIEEALGLGGGRR